MKSSRSVCFVTNELYPFTAGGIGRLVHNLVRESLIRCPDISFHILIPADTAIKVEECSAYFHGAVTVHQAQSLSNNNRARALGADYPPRWAFTDTVEHATSLEIMLKLKELETQGVHFDVVEFADYLGWAFCATQEKHLGRAFARTTLSVRVHSTAGLIQWVEQTPLTLKHVALRDFERKAMLDADLVVAHLESIADYNQKFYGFSREWRERVRIEFPPVVEKSTMRPRSEFAGERDICFVTKVQRCKRPDLFVRGAALFVTNNPQYTGKIRVACHSVDLEYLHSIQKLVPQSLKDRFVFSGPLPGRDELFSKSIVVIPSDYESLNLTAYEAAAAGAILVLNGTCPSFGEKTPFKHASNCYLFDGTPESLAVALSEAVKVKPVGNLECEARIPYYETDEFRVKPNLVGLQRPKVSVVITNFNLGRYLPQALTSLAASTYENIEIILVDDASTDPFDQQMLDVIEAYGEIEGQAIKLIRNPVNRGLPAARNIGIRSSTGDYVLPLDADDRISSTFLEMAVSALEQSKTFDIVVPSTGYFSSDEALDERQFIDYACFIGDGPNVGLVANRFSCATALIRRSVFERFLYDEKLDSYEDWSLYLRMMASGTRFLVTNDIHFHYRRRPGSMIASMKPERHQRLLARLWETLPVPLPPAIHLDVFSAIFSLSRSASEAEDRPLRYRVADWANLLIKRSPRLHQRLKRQIHQFGEKKFAKRIQD